MFVCVGLNNCLSTVNTAMRSQSRNNLANALLKLDCVVFRQKLHAVAFAAFS